MIQRTALIFFLTLLSSQINAQSITSLNSAISANQINRSIAQKIHPIPYAGKDLTFNNLNSPVESSYKTAC